MPLRRSARSRARRSRKRSATRAPGLDAVGPRAARAAQAGTARADALGAREPARRAGQTHDHDPAPAHLPTGRGEARRTRSAGPGRRQRILHHALGVLVGLAQRGLEAVVGVRALVVDSRRLPAARAPHRRGSSRARGCRARAPTPLRRRRQGPGPDRCAPPRAPASGRPSRAGRTAPRSCTCRREGRGSRAVLLHRALADRRADARRGRVDPDQPAVAAVGAVEGRPRRACSRADSSRLPLQTPPRRMRSPRRPKSSGRMFTPMKPGDVPRLVAHPAPRRPPGSRAGPSARAGRTPARPRPPSGRRLGQQRHGALRVLEVGAGWLHRARA